jgi:hypothetical protein
MIMDTLYSPGPYYRRIRTFLREYRRPKISNSFSWRHLLAFAHASLRLGVFGPERFHYWGLLFWTCFCRPSHFALAVTFSVYGYHFRKVSQALAPQMSVRTDRCRRRLESGQPLL